ncbi:unnamed protein product [Symbiodinium pilosum]|uniref:Uncharacterized protein n=1 Tax=Symbiodinium pilosum TaxID=2952 RepID=A0A812R0B3_SYMPI|nr:unnamed protein product [Symbiodinium pilosum]
MTESSAARKSPARGGGRAWKGVRDTFKGFLDELPTKGFANLEGPGKEQVEAAQDRLLEHIVASINQDTAQGKRIRERWTRAQTSNLQVKEALRARNFPIQLPLVHDTGRGRQATRLACEAFFPEQWCQLLRDDEILAELVVDSATNSIVDSFLDAAVQLLEAHQGWSPKSTGVAKSPQHHVSLSSPLLAGGWAALSSTSLPESPRSPCDQQPEVPIVHRQRSVYDSVSRSRSSGELETSAERPSGWSTLKHFRSSKPLDPFMVRLHAFTESQRPARRLVRKPSDPFGPKWSVPMMASNFPEYWNSIAPPPKPTVSLPGTQRASLSEGWEEEEVIPPGYNWLQRKTRDGHTVFPYSLVSHKAFFESYKDPVLKAKAMEVAPLRMTDWETNVSP